MTVNLLSHNVVKSVSDSIISSSGLSIITTRDRREGNLLLRHLHIPSQSKDDHVFEMHILRSDGKKKSNYTKT